MMKATYQALDKETARRAHMGTSFYPDKRGEQEIEGHKEVFEELAAELGDFFTQERADKLRALWTDYLHSHGAVMSSMITGPANFPVERNRKRSDWADNKRKAIYEYCGSLKKWQGKESRREAVEAAGGELAVKKAELAEAVALHEKMKAANKIIKSALKTGGITEETIKKLMETGLKESTVSFITNPPENLRCYGLGFHSFQLTNSNARIKNMTARVAELERQEAAKESGVEPKVFEIDGGTVVYDYAENRINVKHDAKPERAVIDEIKAAGFHWSRSFGHWTRQMTPNAKYSAERLIEKLGTKAAA
jgi:hypothetical protein